MNLNNWQTQIRKGLLEIAVLNLLRSGPRHGYEMVQSLKNIAGLKIREGNIYIILARLQIDGAVKSRSEPSEDGPPRNYFELTDSGKKALTNMNAYLDQIVDGVRQIRKGQV